MSRWTVYIDNLGGPKKTLPISFSSDGQKLFLHIAMSLQLHSQYMIEQLVGLKSLTGAARPAVVRFVPPFVRCDVPTGYHLQ